MNAVSIQPGAAFSLSLQKIASHHFLVTKMFGCTLINTGTLAIGQCMEKISSSWLCYGTVCSGSKIISAVQQNKIIVVHYATTAVFPGTGG